MGTPQRIKLKDERTVDMASGKPVTDATRMGHEIDPAIAEDIVQEAAKQGVDPHTALAIAMQETGIDWDENNPFHVVVDGVPEEEQKRFNQNPVAYSMSLLKDKLEYAKKLGKKGEASQLQAWNGYGKVGKLADAGEDGPPINQWYGIDVSKEPIDMNKTPVYGNRIIDLRDNVLKKNPQINRIVAQYHAPVQEVPKTHEVPLQEFHEGGIVKGGNGKDDIALVDTNTGKDTGVRVEKGEMLVVSKENVDKARTAVDKGDGKAALDLLSSELDKHGTHNHFSEGGEADLSKYGFVEEKPKTEAKSDDLSQYGFVEEKKSPSGNDSSQHAEPLDESGVLDKMNAGVGHVITAPEKDKNEWTSGNKGEVDPEKEAIYQTMQILKNPVLKQKEQDLVSTLSTKGDFLNGVSKDPIVQQIHSLSDQYTKSTDEAEKKGIKAKLGELYSQKVNAPFVSQPVSQDEPGDPSSIQIKAYNDMDGDLNGATYADLMTKKKDEQAAYDKAHEEYSTLTQFRHEAIKAAQDAKGFTVNDKGVKVYATPNPLKHPIDAITNASGAFVHGLSGTIDNIDLALDRFDLSDEEMKKRLSEKYVKDQYLYPTQTEGVGAGASEMLGGVAPLAVQGFIAPESVLAQVVMGSTMMGAVGAGNGLYTGFVQGKQDGMTDSEALAHAKKNSNIEGVTQAVVGGIMPLNSGITDKLILQGGERSALQKFAVESGLMSTEFGAGQVVSNVAEGKDPESDVSKVVTDGLLLSVLTHSIAQGLKLPSKIKSIYDVAIARRLPDIEGPIKQGIASGVIDPVQGTKLLSEAQENADVIQKLPHDWSAEEIMVAKPFQQKIDQYHEDLKNATSDVVKADIKAKQELVGQEMIQAVGQHRATEEQAKVQKGADLIKDDELLSAYVDQHPELSAERQEIAQMKDDELKKQRIEHFVEKATGEMPDSFIEHFAEHKKAVEAHEEALTNIKDIEDRRAQEIADAKANVKPEDLKEVLENINAKHDAEIASKLTPEMKDSLIGEHDKAEEGLTEDQKLKLDKEYEQHTGQEATGQSVETTQTDKERPEQAGEVAGTKTPETKASQRIDEYIESMPELKAQKEKIEGFENEKLRTESMDLFKEQVKATIPDDFKPKTNNNETQDVRSANVGSDSGEKSNVIQITTPESESEAKGEITNRSGDDGAGGEKVEPSKISDRQKSINDLIDLQDRYNDMSDGARGKGSAGGQRIRMTIKEKSAELGLTHIERGKAIEVRSERGKAVKRNFAAEGNKGLMENHIPLAERGQETQDLFTKLDKSGVHSFPTVEGVDGKQMSERQIKNAIKDVKEGKHTNGAEALLNELDHTLDKGYIEVGRHDIGYSDVPLDDYLNHLDEIDKEELTDEQRKQTEAAYDNWYDSLTDEQKLKEEQDYEHYERENAERQQLEAKADEGNELPSESAGTGEKDGGENQIPETDEARIEAQGKRRNSLIDHFEGQISDVKERLSNLKAKRASLEREVAAKVSTQGDMFSAEEAKPEQGTLLDVKPEYNEEITGKVFDDVDGAIKKAQKELLDLENLRDHVMHQSELDLSGRNELAEGVHDLAEILGAVHDFNGAQKPSVIEALGKIARGLVNSGIAKVQNIVGALKDFLHDKWDDHFYKFSDDIRQAVEDGVKEAVDEKGQQAEKDKRDKAAAEIKTAIESIKKPSVKETLANTKFFHPFKSFIAAFHPFAGVVDPFGFARDASVTIRQRLGEENFAKVQVEEAHDALMKKWNTVPREERLGFILSMQNPEAHGAVLGKFQGATDLYRARLDKVFDVISSIKDIQALEDYFPQFWKDPQKAKETFTQVLKKRPLEGSKSFLKHRFYDTIMEGSKAGLKLVTDNPEEMVRLAEMNAWKFKTAHDIFMDFKKQDLLKFSKFGDQPQGWQTVEDPIFKRMVAFNIGGEAMAKMGAYFMPEEVSRVINNYLSPGIFSRPDWIGSIGRSIRAFNNIKTMFQLGLSAYHAVTTSVDSTVTGLSFALQSLSTLRPTEMAKGLLKAGTSFASVPDTFMRGWKANKEYALGNVSSKDVQALIAANGRTKLSGFYETDAAYQASKAFNQLRVDHDFSVIPKMVWNGILTMPEILSKPIMHTWVPALKTGGYLKSYEQELKANPTMSEKEQAVKRLELWDNQDDRLGQVVYDNLFWNKTMKDIGFMAIRSLGWSGGTVKAFGKAAGDIPESAKRMLQGKGITQRLSWALSLPIAVGVMGAMYQKVMTGQGPDDAMDLYFPKDGTKNPDGTDHRLELPSYVKDVFAYKRDVKQTVANKLAPIWSESAELLSNKDFYGNQIYKPAENWYEGIPDKTADIAAFEGKSFIPFSFQESNNIADKVTSESDANTQWWEKKFGMMPAPKAVTRTDTENRIMEAVVTNIRKDSEVHTKEENQITQARSALKENIWVNMKQQGLDPTYESAEKVLNENAAPALKEAAKITTDKEKDKLLKDAHVEPFERRFNHLSKTQKVEVYDKMTDEEKGRFFHLMPGDWKEEHAPKGEDEENSEVPETQEAEN